MLPIHLTRDVFVFRFSFFFYYNVNTSDAFVLSLFLCLFKAAMDETLSLAIVFMPGDAFFDLAEEVSLPLHLHQHRDKQLRALQASP